MICDALATRYGRWPHEVLELDPWQFELARLSYEAGDSFARRRVEAVQAAHPGWPLPVPVVVVR